MPATYLPNDVPILDTGRLRLRPYRANDLAACAALWEDPITIRYTTGKPLTREDVWLRILAHAGSWALLGYGLWALEDKATGKYVGELGFIERARDIYPSFEGIPEAAWVLDSRLHGKGYATEGVSAVVAWGDKNFKAARTVCLIQEGNTASLRVAVKCGYRECARTSYKDQRVIVLERYRSA